MEDSKLAISSISDFKRFSGFKKNSEKAQKMEEVSRQGTILKDISSHVCSFFMLQENKREGQTCNRLKAG